MWANYKQTLIKYIKSPSTWVILVIAMFISGFLSAGLPWLNFDQNKPGATNSYIIRVVSTIATASSFMAIFASIFAGFKSAAMFRDEMDQGTFLTLVSKPIRRSSILIGKWLALQTTLIGFAFFTTISFGIVTAVLDKGHYLHDLSVYEAKTLRSQLPMVMIYLFVIIFLMCLIFSSISLLISTKLSYGGTIGASIALGVIIPITSLTWTFTHKESHYSLTSRRALTNIMNFDQKFRELNGLDGRGLSDNTKKQQEIYFEKLKDENSIFGLGIGNGMTDAFEDSWVGDLQYQISRMGAFASEEAIPIKSELLAATAADPSELGRTDLTPDRDHNLSAHGKVKDVNRGHTAAFWYIVDGLKEILGTYDLIAQDGITQYWETINHAFNNPTDEWKNKNPNFNKNTLLTVNNDGGVLTHLKDELGWMVGKSDDEVWAAIDHNYSHGNSPEHDKYINDKKKDPSLKPWFDIWRQFYNELNTNINKVSLDTIWKCFDTIFNMNKYGRTLSSTIGVYNKDDAGQGYFIARATSHYAMSFNSKELLKKMYTQKRLDDFVYNYEDWFDEIRVLDAPVSKVLFNRSAIDRSAESWYQDVNKGRKEFVIKENLFPSRNFQDAEMNYINSLLTIADEHPEAIVKLSTKGYADKKTILWVYFAIAFGLLPFVYLIIRFKDYR